ncbi:MAG: hypothetical protein NVSMB13_03630 [Mycobacteriales bacterium]
MPVPPAYDGSAVEELVGLLRHELTGLLDRLAAWPARRWAGVAGPFASRAEAARHLADGLAAASWRLESAPVDQRPPVPDLGADAVVVDQLAVTADDLDRALRDPDRLTGSAAGPIAAHALAEVVLHRHDLDGIRPTSRVALAVLGVLVPGEPRSEPVVEVLAAARGWCPSPGGQRSSGSAS